MPPLLVLDHLLNFAAPALWMAGLVLLAGRLVLPAGRPMLPWPLRLAAHCGVGLAVQLAGLLLTGHDGSMATWTALVVLVASSEWVLGGGWRR